MNLLTKSILIALIALAVNSSAQAKYTGNLKNTIINKYENLNDYQWIEKAIDNIVKDNDLPALTVALVKNGRATKFINKGVLNRKTKIPTDVDTLFQIGSLTKTFTGIIANNLILEGKIDPEASLVKYLPNSLTPGAKKKLSAIKIKNLLHHRSGIPRDSKVYHRFGNDPMICCYTEKDLLTDLEVMELDFPPDSKSEYSNMGFAVLGYVFERASGKSYEELLQTYVSRKLNLKNTTTTPSESQKKFLATPYRKENRRYQTKPFEMGKMVSGGGIFSTISDLSKLMVSQMADYRNFLNNKKETSLILTKNTSPFNKRLSYGYGLFATSKGGYGHGGDLDGFGSGYTFIPGENVGVIFLTSSGGGWTRQFENTILQKLRGRTVKMPLIRSSISVRDDLLDKYTGAYQIAGGLIINIARKGARLEAYPQSSFGPIELFFETENKLYSKTYDEFFEFEFGKDGAPDKVFYNFRGRKLPAVKLD